MRILLVDDNKTNLALLTHLVERLADCQAVPFLRPDLVLEQVPQLKFDIAIFDFQMPGMNGIELMKALVSLEQYREKAFVFVTGATDIDTRMAALNCGAMDYLTKPINPLEFSARVRNLVALADARNKLADRAAWLKSEVDKATAELKDREHEIIDRLTMAAGYKDPETGKHTQRVGAYAEAIALAYGLDQEVATDIRWAAPMHDIGKVATPDAILLKKGKLTDEEFNEMKQHASIGYQILAGSQSKLLQLAAEIAGSHHERWDGTGYPQQRRRFDIPLSARIVAIADTFDALTVARPYKPAWSFEDAVAYIVSCADSHFDPACVVAFSFAKPRIRDIMQDYEDQAEEHPLLAACL
ncbi:HD domain-containing phosphohydrolase [Agrobacterium sp.]|uniref:HD domain-containing phosphohydrolase n=1 Tax=Agrobacterium sp. TaxID=361 RepID=UPI0028AD21AB